MIVFALYGLYPEALGDHGEDREAPSLPLGMIVVGFLEGAQMPEGPGHNVSIAFDIAYATIDIPMGCSEDGRYISGDARLLSDAYDHG